MFYKDSTVKDIKEGKWNERYAVIREGGYTLDISNLPAALAYIAKGAIVSLADGKAKLLKTVRVYEAAEKSATTLKVESGSAIAVGDKIAGATVSAIAVGESYDTLTVSALSSAAAVGDVLAEAISGTLALVAVTKPIKGTPDIAATLQAYEIEEASLPYPVNADIKEALTARHAFKI